MEHKKTPLARMLIVAGALAGASALAHAQLHDRTWDSPPRAGEASTMVGGEPNRHVTTYGLPAPVIDASSGPVVQASSGPVLQTWYFPDGTQAHVASGLHVMGAPGVVSVPHVSTTTMGAAAVTTPIPLDAGEASTMVGGEPNRHPPQAGLNAATVTTDSTGPYFGVTEMGPGQLYLYR